MFLLRICFSSFKYFLPYASLSLVCLLATFGSKLFDLRMIKKYTVRQANSSYCYRKLFATTNDKNTNRNLTDWTAPAWVHSQVWIFNNISILLVKKGQLQIRYVLNSIPQNAVLREPIYAAFLSNSRLAKQTFKVSDLVSPSSPYRLAHSCKI